MGILITPTLKKKFKFIDNESITKQIVGVTCETCAVKDCSVRAATPIQLEQKIRNENTDLIVNKYIEKYS
mgnify:FL=1